MYIFLQCFIVKVFFINRRTEDCLKEHLDKLDQLAELLLKKETLHYQDVEDLLGLI